MAAVLELHDSEDAPDPPVMVPGVRAQVRFVEFIATTRATVPAKPFDGAMLIVEAPETPASTVRLF